MTLLNRYVLLQRENEQSRVGECKYTLWFLFWPGSGKEFMWAENSPKPPNETIQT